MATAWVGFCFPNSSTDLDAGAAHYRPPAVMAGLNGLGVMAAWTVTRYRRNNAGASQSMGDHAGLIGSPLMNPKHSMSGTMWALVDKPAAGSTPAHYASM